MQLISTDFDGTIYDSFETPPIPHELIQWLCFARKSGAKWVVNTGRELQDVVEEIRFLQIELFPDFVISEERHIYQRHEDCYHEHEEWNTACYTDHQILFAEAADSLNRIRGWVEDRFVAHLYSDPLSPLCIIAWHPSDADHIHQQVEEECRGVPGLSVVRNAHYFRFAHVRYSKGTALSEIARVVGVEKSKIFAAGDHYNDLSALDGTHAEYVAAPSNAIPQVKATVLQAGGYVADRPYGFGVVDALNFFRGRFL